MTNTNGLLTQYLQKNSSNYKAKKVGTNNFYSSPLNLSLTKAALNFLEKTFDMPERFTKYVFVEEISVFFIRTH